jgi:hypothetical protein
MPRKKKGLIHKKHLQEELATLNLEEEEPEQEDPILDWVKSHRRVEHSKVCTACFLKRV